MEDRDQDEPVVDMTDCTAALVGIALQDNISRRQVEPLFPQHFCHVRPKLAHDHSTFWVCNHGKFVMLFAYDR